MKPSKHVLFLSLVVALCAAPASALADNVRFPDMAVGMADAGAEVSVDSAGNTMGGGKGGVPVANGLSTSPEALADVPPVADPVEDPGSFISTVRDLFRKGWWLAAIAVLVGGAMLARRYVAVLRVEGTRGAAVASAVITAGGALIAVLTGTIPWDVFGGVVVGAVMLVISPQAPPPKTVQ